MQGRSERNAENAAAFFSALAETGHVGKACELAGLTRSIVYGWRAADPTFSEEWDVALQRGIDALEDEAMRRAAHGVAKPVFYKGEVCGHVQEYSDLLTIFLLKGNRPDKYADRAKMEHSGSVTVNAVNYAEMLREAVTLEHTPKLGGDAPVEVEQPELPLTALPPPATVLAPPALRGAPTLEDL